MAPLIVSLGIDEQHQRRLDDLRRQHFPRGRTRVGAHLTLFHALPGDREPEVREALAHAARRPPFDIELTAVTSLGRGAALRVVSGELDAVHARLRRRFADVLTPQDAQPFRPHVTVQNKVDVQLARDTVAHLRAGFAPYAVAARGLHLWRYDDGPWTPVAQYPFATTD